MRLDTGSKPSRTQHRALKIPDIISELLERVVEGKGRKDRAKALLSMALCCWDFRSPSLDMLWKTMDSFDPLLMLLPGAFRTPKGQIFFQWEFVDPTQLVKFTEYGRRIVDLEIVVSANFVEIPMWRWLEDRDNALLPSLRSLKILYRGASLLGKERTLFILPTLLRSPVLHSVAIDMRTKWKRDKQGLGPIFRLIVDSETSVKSLSLSGALYEKYTPCLAMLPNIQSLSLKLSDIVVMLNALSFLTWIPHLQELSLDLSAFITVPMKEARFPCLAQLTLHGTLQVVGEILACITVERLEALTVYSTANTGPLTPESHPPALLQLIRSRFCTVRKVRVDWEGGTWNYARKTKNAISFIKPLVKLSHVEELVLTSLECSTCFSDKDIIDLANACGSRLKILRLEHKGPPTGPHPSFSCLEHLAMTCPRLTELSLTLTEGTFQTPDYVSNHALASLHLQHTDIVHPARVARYIDGLFPHLVRFDSMVAVVGRLVAAVIFDTCKPVRKDQEKRVRDKQKELDLFKQDHEISRY